MTTAVPSASYSLTVRLEIENKPGMLGKVTSAIGKAGGDIGAVDLVEMRGGRVLRDITIKASDSQHGQDIIERLRGLAGVRVANISDRTFLMHLGGKIEVRSKVPIRTRDDLSMAYTPGRGASVHGHQGGSLARLHADHQAQCGGGGDRRDRGPGPGRYRAGSGHAGHGGQGHALQGAGRGGRLSHRARIRKTPRRSSRPSSSSPLPSAASTSRTSRPPAASRSRAGSARSWTSPSSTTTSTAPRWWCWPRCSTR